MALPGILGQIEGLIGTDKAVALMQAFGGREVTIPKKPEAGMELPKVIGVEAARVLASDLGSGRVLIPMAQSSRVARLRRMLKDGISHQKIAAALGCHVRTVEYHAAKVRKDPQLELDLRPPR
ncbi:MAG: hypothetical protein AAFR17_12400 [Pseudomonadota bacterium]